MTQTQLTQLPQLPLLIEPDQLQALLDSPEILIVDLCRRDVYLQVHVPGAVHLDYSQIIAARPPVMGLLPDAATLSKVLSAIGLTAGRHVIAYDEEGGGKAARLIWTLDAIGHTKSSLLNGGIHAWMKEKHPTTTAEARPVASQYTPGSDATPVAERNYILDHLNDGTLTLLDARTAEEYRGEKKFAARGGHIPGAVNLDWSLLMDKTRNMRLKPEADLRALLAERGIATDKTVVTYCQTHHRSALTYFVLKLLGYPAAKGYPGSWSDWGNADNTPVAAP